MERFNFNYRQVGEALQASLWRSNGITGAITAFEPANWDIYNALQVSVQKNSPTGSP